MADAQHLVIGTPVRGRNQTEVESVMGYFNNLLPLHMTVNPSLSFVDFVRQVKATAIESFGYPDVPLEYLQRELHRGREGGSVLYQALFSFQDARQRVVDWGGLGHEQILLFQSGATEDLGLWFLESIRGMVGGVTYNADIIDGATARLMRDGYLALMTRVSENPELSIGELIEQGEDLQRLRHWGQQARRGDATEPRAAMAASAQPGTPDEQKLATIWKELLNIDEVHTSDNFFDVGGHSLMAVEMATRVQRETGVRLNLLDIANGTLATLAAELAAAPSASNDHRAPLAQRLRGLFGRR
jgi:acyl carrier protein